MSCKVRVQANADGSAVKGVDPASTVEMDPAWVTSEIMPPLTTANIALAEIDKAAENLDVEATPPSAGDTTPDSERRVAQLKPVFDQIKTASIKLSTAIKLLTEKLYQPKAPEENIFDWQRGLLFFSCFSRADIEQRAAIW